MGFGDDHIHGLTGLLAQGGQLDLPLGRTIEGSRLHELGNLVGLLESASDELVAAVRITLPRGCLGKDERTNEDRHPIP